MTKIHVRKAQSSDVSQILSFVKEQWKRDHIFVLQQETFLWQHRDGDEVNAIIAVNDDRQVLGLLGYIPFRHFDPALAQNPIFLALWKAHETEAPPGLGLRLFKTLLSVEAPEFVGAIGISEYVKPIYEMFGYEVSEMEHLVLFNHERLDNLSIAQMATGAAFEKPEPKDETAKLAIMTGDEFTKQSRKVVDELGAFSVPARSFDYALNRYANHPWYSYEFLVVSEEGSIRAIAFARAVAANQSTALRIVDCIGDIHAFGGVGNQLQKYLREKNAEYIDLLYWSDSDIDLGSAGFVNKRAVEGLIVPDFFAPFVRDNVTISLAVKNDLRSDGRPVMLFKAHSDQDRPNTLEDLTNG